MIAFHVVWVAVSTALVLIYRWVAGGRSGWRPLLLAGFTTGAFLSGFLQGFLLFLAIPVEWSLPFGGLPIFGAVVALALWLYALHLIVLLGYRLMLVLEQYRAELDQPVGLGDAHGHPHGGPAAQARCVDRAASAGGTGPAPTGGPGAEAPVRPGGTGESRAPAEPDRLGEVDGGDVLQHGDHPPPPVPDVQHLPFDVHAHPVTVLDGRAAERSRHRGAAKGTRPARLGTGRCCPPYGGIIAVR